MSYIVPVHRPTSTRHAIKLGFVIADEDALVVAKANRLEIYTQSAEGYSLLASKTVYGYITMLERLRPTSSQTDHLFVGTDRFQYFTCSWDQESKQLITQQSYVDVADKQLRDSRETDRCHVDPTRRYMTLELYDGVLTVVPITQPQQGTKKIKTEKAAGSLGEPVQARIEEMMTRDSAFLQMPPQDRQSPKLAILWEDNSEIPQLKIRELKYYPEGAGDPASVDVKGIAELREDLDLGVSHLIPVSHPWSGFLVLGERSISYTNSCLTKLIKQSLDDEATIWTCWTQVDDVRWLLADDYGRLYFIMISTAGGEVDGWRLESVGTASKASCLVYLDEGYVFVGSHAGNSQIVKIVEGGVEVMQEFDNIAPILDFSIMDLGRGSEGAQAEFSTGQARIVTASGAWQDGSIRSVRSGVGMEELGSIGEFDLITDLWALRSTSTGEFDDILLTTFAEQTRIFRFDASGTVEEVPEFSGLELQEPTLFVSNLPDGKLLQVHESGVRVTDLESGMLESQWKPQDGGAKITAASANSVHLLVVEGGHTLHLFHTSNNLTPTVSKSFLQDSQISSVTLPNSRSSSCIVSFWQSASISVVDLHSLETITTQSLGEPGSAIPRSVVVAEVLPESNPTLFIAMADGTVVTYTFDPNKNTLSGMTSIILGSEPVFFKLLPRNAQSSSSSSSSNVFASCEQPSLIYASEGRIIYSAVNSDKASRVCHFDSQAFPGAVAIATPTELKLAIIGTERTTQLQTLPVNETVRCLAYEPRAKMFGMGCVRRILEAGTEALLSCVKVADEVTFQELDSFELQDNELIECITSTGPLEADLEDIGYEEMFIVGTSMLEEVSEGDGVVKGRILVFEFNKEKRKLQLVTSLSVKGACRSLAMCDGKLVAGLVKTVVVYNLDPTVSRGKQSLTLRKLTAYRTSTNPLDLSITSASPSLPATIAVADLMKSLSIVTLTPPSTSSTKDVRKAMDNSYDWSMFEIARHFATVWSSAVACTGENEWLLADMEGNLMVLRRNTNGPTAEDRKRLEVISEFRLGEVVNKIKPIMSPAVLANIMAEHAPGKGKARAGTATTAREPALKEAHSALDVEQPASTTSRTGPLVYPTAFLATVEGGVYLHGTINPSYTDLLLRLQSAITSRIQAPGHMPWSNFRAVRTEVREAEEPYRVVDGEVLELVLGIGEDVLEEVVGELNAGSTGVGGGVGKEQVKAWVEGLRRLY